MLGVLMTDETEAESRAEDVSVREAFRQLGFPESLLARAIQGFGTVERAKQWIEILGPPALAPDYIYEIAMSKIAPADYLHWRDTGLGPLEAIRTPRHLAKAGLDIDDYRRWRSAGLGKGLWGFVPHLMSGLSFDELIHFLTEWNKVHDPGCIDGAREFTELLSCGLNLGEFRQQLASDMSGHQIYMLRRAGIPSSQWKAWMDLGFDGESAGEYFNAGVAAATGKLWANLGLAPKESLAFMKAGVPVATVQEWISAGITGIAALRFITQGLSLAEAQPWASSGFSADEAADHIRNGVHIDEALDFEARGIASWQVKRTKSGLKLDLYPWQKDPADQLPEVIKRGQIKFTLWTDVLGGDQQAHDIAFKWDGRRTVEWFEDISAESGDLSPGSSSPTWGVASWPNERDVLMTYTWADFGLKGYARLAEVAPPFGSKGVGDPHQWVRFGRALVEFVLLDLGSGNHEPGELATKYYCPASNEVVDLDEIFRAYLDAVEKVEVSQEFDEWLRQQLSEGAYTTDVDDETLEAKAVAESAQPPRPDPQRAPRRGLGKNQRRIIELLGAATADGLNTAEIAKSLGVTAEAVMAALERLEKRRVVVLTTYRSIAWLPARRLVWLQRQAATTSSVTEEIAALSALLEQQRASP